MAKPAKKEIKKVVNKAEKPRVSKSERKVVKEVGNVNENKSKPTKKQEVTSSKYE